jgi:hypothetical protein
MAMAGCMVKLALAFIKKDFAPFPKQFTWDVLLLFVLALLLAWGSTFVRGAIYLASPQFYIPVARYALPAIVPAGLILAGGLVFMITLPLTFFKRWIENPQIPAGWIYSVCLLIIDLYAIWSIYQFYKS